MRIFPSVFILILLHQVSFADITMPAIFGNHMVLQQQSDVALWGWGKPLEVLKIKVGWLEDTLKHEIDNSGRWTVSVPTPAAGGPYSIYVMGYNTLTFEDVWIGEVWLCSGQSNMEWSARMGIDDGEKAVRESENDRIRFFTTAHRTSDVPQEDLSGTWVLSSPETMIDFSAVGYFFGKRLNEELEVPVGLIDCSWGGSPIETWMPGQIFQLDPQLKAASNMLPDVPWAPNEPGVIFNGMIAPLAPFNISGVIWYQGESNTANALYYEELLESMITSWRKIWQNDFPFYFVQIAPHKYGRSLEGVVVRDEMRKVLDLKKTGMVVISDIGNVEDIHPRNKHDVGKRLANLALKETYNQKIGQVNSPEFDYFEVKGRQVVVHFKNATEGLEVKGENLTGFELAGVDQVFYESRATVKGNTVLLHSKEVEKPVAVRFAFSNTSEPNLFNKAGLPASSFRTDEWPLKMEPQK